MGAEGDVADVRLALTLALTLSVALDLSEQFPTTSQSLFDSHSHTLARALTHSPPRRPHTPSSASACSIPRFDHHCGWLNQCVGQKNYKYFLLFLFSNAIMLCYGALAMGCVLASIVKENRLFESTFVHRETKEKIPGNWRIVLQVKTTRRNGGRQGWVAGREEGRAGRDGRRRGAEGGEKK